MLPGKLGRSGTAQCRRPRRTKSCLPGSERTDRHLPPDANARLLQKAQPFPAAKWRRAPSFQPYSQLAVLSRVVVAVIRGNFSVLIANRLAPLPGCRRHDEQPGEGVGGGAVRLRWVGACRPAAWWRCRLRSTARVAWCWATSASMSGERSTPVTSACGYRRGDAPRSQHEAAQDQQALHLRLPRRGECMHGRHRPPPEARA